MKMRKAIFSLLAIGLLSMAPPAQNASPDNHPAKGEPSSKSTSALPGEGRTKQSPSPQLQAGTPRSQADPLQQEKTLEYSRRQTEAAENTLWIARYGLFFAIVQAAFFIFQLRELRKATQAADAAARAAHHALLADTLPDIRITNAQIWPADGRKGDTVELSPGSKYRIRIHAVNIGQTRALLCSKEPNAAMAHFSNGRKHLPMFRPFKPESPEYAEENTHRLKLPGGGGEPASLEPGEFGLWDFETFVPEAENGQLSLYVIGLIAYWNLVDDGPNRRRITGFAFRFEKNEQRFAEISREEEPNYRYVE